MTTPPERESAADLRFVQVGELGRAMAHDAEAPSSPRLSGSSFVLYDETGGVTRYTFSGESDLTWEVEQGDAAGSGAREECWAAEPRDGVFLVDYVAWRERATSVSMVLDLPAGAATVVVGTLPEEKDVQKSAVRLARDGESLTAVGARFVRAAIDRPFDAAAHAHAPTSEMVGHRVQYVYTPTEAYEHIYLNDRLYTWQCLSGVEKGLADTDVCHAWKLGDKLYLFVWRERVVPTLGVVVVDWREMRSTGKLFGYESDDFGDLSNTHIASKATLLNVTEYV